MNGGDFLSTRLVVHTSLPATELWAGFVFVVVDIRTDEGSLYVISLSFFCFGVETRT